MSESPLQVSCIGLSDNLAAVLPSLVASAGQALELEQDFSAIRICADDLPGSEGAWYRLENSQVRGAKPRLTLYCQEYCFGPLERGSASVHPPRAVWEQSPVPGPAEAGFSRDRAGIFLHHHLLTARDLAQGVVVGRNLPATLTEAFTEAWAVSVDGRLSRRGLPGFPLAERRGSFARVFSPAGILLPDHWQVFQSLWDGAISNQKDVLGVLKWLPGL